jgi:hypothetical protein
VEVQSSFHILPIAKSIAYVMLLYNSGGLSTK